MPSSASQEEAQRPSHVATEARASWTFEFNGGGIWHQVFCFTFYRESLFLVYALRNVFCRLLTFMQNYYKKYTGKSIDHIHQIELTQCIKVNKTTSLEASSIYKPIILKYLPGKGWLL